MKDLVASRQKVRAHVALSTRDLHAALHEDAVLGRLTAQDITPQCYRLALGVLQAFYVCVERERSRQDVFPQLSLMEVCAALQSDIGQTTLPTPKLSFVGQDELLGGLYVAHGASFGRSSFRANIADKLSYLPQTFLNLTIEKKLWRSLVAVMEERGGTPAVAQSIEAGAAKSFAEVAQLSRRALVN